MNHGGCFFSTRIRICTGRSHKIIIDSFHVDIQQPFYYIQKEFIAIYYSDVIMSAMASQITGLSIVYPTVCSGADQLRVTGLCDGNSRVTGEFPAQRASNAKIVSIWWRHHETKMHLTTVIRNISAYWYIVMKGNIYVWFSVNAYILPTTQYLFKSLDYIVNN